VNWRRAGLVLIGLCGALYLLNASWRVAAPGHFARLIAHRGVHQRFDPVGLGYDGCSASRSVAPLSPFIENTIPSMRAAFAQGADVVEIDAAPTKDGQFAVFHDWTLECRTNGIGEVRAQDMAALRQLDVGHGYTLDGGQTFPMRGQGRGMLPSLSDVFIAIPEGRFLVNFKSAEAREGDMLADLLVTHPEWRAQVWGVYGDAAPVHAAQGRIADLRAFVTSDSKVCLKRYILLGWSGYVPQACRDSVVMLPINVAPWMFGWPNLFQKRLQQAGSEVVLVGPYRKGIPAGGINSAVQRNLAGQNFGGYIWTDAIEVIPD